MYPVFDKLSIWGKFILLAGLIILGIIVSTGLGLIVVYFVFGPDSAATLLNGLTTCETCIAPLKVMQILNHLGIFTIPAIVWIWLVKGRIWNSLLMNSAPESRLLLITVAIVFIIGPFTAWVMEINEKMVLPEIFNSIEIWMRHREDSAAEITAFFLQGSTPVGFMLNLFMMAILPALGEEILFRGLIQQQLQKYWRNPHLAILGSAILFSAIHFQFYGFLPRVLLGMAFGYLLYFSSNLWYPIAAHFVNNAMAVVVYYLHDKGQISTPVEDFGKLPQSGYIISSFLLSIFLLWIFRRGIQRW